MLKKIIIGIFIVGLLVGLSYLKTMRDTDEKATAYNQGQKESEESLTSYKSEVDSLNTAINEKEIAYIDTLNIQDNNYSNKIDSLNSIVNKQSSEINNLKSKVQTSQKNTTNNINVKKTLSLHEKVYQYYKTRYTSLPKDLSSYEKKIALNEIREETTQKYSISMNELEKIRRKYKLNY